MSSIIPRAEEVQLPFLSGNHRFLQGSFDKEYYFPGEPHDFWELVCVLDGHITVSADERVYPLAQDEIILHKPMEMHKFRVNMPQTHLFIMSFSAEGDFTERLENYVFRFSPDQSEQLFHILHHLRQGVEMNKDSDNHFNEKHSVYFLEQIQNFPEMFQMIYCMTEIFLLSLFKNKAIPTVTEHSAVVFKNAIKLMENYIEDWISVPEIAKECHVSVTYLKKIFSEYAGMGIHKYFLNLKIKRASQLLLKGETVADISQKLSFRSQNYFSIVYKRETGMSPSGYRKSKREGL